MNYREVDLLITGQRLRDHYLILLRGKSVWLTFGSLRVLVTLVAARGQYVADTSVAHPVAVCRLRRILQRGVGHARARALIETGSGREYRLKPGTTVAVERDLLPCLERTDPDLAQLLRESGVDWIDEEEPTSSPIALAA
jgi:hypothetical protein